MHTFFSASATLKRPTYLHLEKLFDFALLRLSLSPLLIERKEEKKQGRNLQITNMAAKSHVQRVAAVGRELATENLQIDFCGIRFTDHGEY